MANIKGRCEPAYSIVMKLGGVCRTADVCGITPGAVSRWLSEDGGNGIVPVKHWYLIMAYSKRRRIKMTLNGLSGIAP